jgi:NADH-quinone oxidoreductase subunit A
MDQYLPLVVMFLLAVGFVVLSITTSKLLAPGRPTLAKQAPYECGIVPTRDAVRRFPVRFYLVAMIFIVFDIEIIFLFPWAVVYRELGAFGLWAIVAFIVPFFLSFLWEVAEGGLDWGPLAARRPLGALTDPGRTASSTVRLVGVDGREAVPAGVTAEPVPEKEKEGVGAR